jgi:hypothetical protein
MFYGICIIILLKKIVVAYFLSSNLNKFLKLQQAETNRFRHAPHRLMFIKQQKKLLNSNKASEMKKKWSKPPRARIFLDSSENLDLYLLTPTRPTLKRLGV